jgi:hypothetical protein
MNRVFITVGVLLCIVFAVNGCTKKPTPSHVQEAYDELLANVDNDRPGHTIQEFTAFKKRYKGFDITNLVSMKIDDFNNRIADNYAQACLLARDGEFDRADVILQDLAKYFPSLPTGKKAKQYLRFDFRMKHANHHMERKKVALAREILTVMRVQRLKPYELQQVNRAFELMVEGYLDHFQTGCKTLYLSLLGYHRKYGTFPKNLDLESLVWVALKDKNRITDAISTIRDYQADKNHFSLVAVSMEQDLLEPITQRGLGKTPMNIVSR